MKTFMTRIQDDRGAGIIEYGLIVGVISLLSLTAVTLVGDETSETFTTVAEAIENPPGSEGGSVHSGSGAGGEGASDAGSGAQDEDTDEPASDDTTGADANDDDANIDNSSEPLDEDADGSADDDGDGSSDDGSSSDDNSDNGDSTDDETQDDEEEAVPGSKAQVTGTASDFTWWNDTKNGGNGEWKASVTFENDWIRHQYLTLEVTTVNHKGKTSTSTVKNFYVPAGGSATYHDWGNVLKDKNGKITGTLEVQVKVVAVTTSDENWVPAVYPSLDAEPQIVSAPDIP